jgi:hypothetical protein
LTGCASSLALTPENILAAGLQSDTGQKALAQSEKRAREKAAKEEREAKKPKIELVQSFPRGGGPSDDSLEGGGGMSAGGMCYGCVIVLGLRVASSVGVAQHVPEQVLGLLCLLSRYCIPDE